MSKVDVKDEVEGRHVDILSSDVKVLDNADLLNEAFDGENEEHGESLWSSAKAHPWACLWAFIMCFTIVSLCFRAVGSIGPLVNGS